MNVNIDQIIDELMPWDLSLTVGGVVCRTRPLVLADLLRIQAVFGQHTDEAQAAALLADFFVDPRPDVKSWGIEKLLAALTAIGDYARSRAEKNSGSIVQAVRRTMGTVGTARLADGACSPRS